MVPWNSSRMALILSSFMFPWSLVTQMYSLPERRRAWRVLEASWRVMGRMPVTLGSRVPP